MAGDKRVPSGWEEMKHIQVKFIKNRAYIYRYDPNTQRETYLGAAEPVFGIIDSMSEAEQKKIVEMFNTGKSVWNIVDYIKERTGDLLTKQSVYAWLRAR